jgi:hypothetical protein
LFTLGLGSVATLLRSSGLAWSILQPSWPQDLTRLRSSGRQSAPEQISAFSSQASILDRRFMGYQFGCLDPLRMDDGWEDEKEAPSPQEIDFCTLGMFIIGKTIISCHLSIVIPLSLVQQGMAESPRSCSARPNEVFHLQLGYSGLFPMLHLRRIGVFNNFIFCLSVSGLVIQR